MNHELDIIHDISPEGMFTLAKQSPDLARLVQGLPLRPSRPDPAGGAVQRRRTPMFKNRDVRWALALLIDIKAVSMASYRGAATISAIGMPPTGSAPEDYHEPIEDWLKAFEIDTGKQKIKPYDPTIGKQIADMLRPSLKEQIPTDPAEIAKSFGRGWWKPNPQAAHRAAARAPATPSKGDKWYMPDGKPFTIQRHGRGRAAAGDDPRRHHDRAAMAPVRHRRHDRGGAGQHARPPRRRRLRGDDQLERRDLGRPSRPRLLPRQLALAVRGAARQAAAAAQLAALEQPRARQDHRADRARSASTIPRASSSAATT